MTAGAVVAFGTPLSGFAAYQLVEVAFTAGGKLILYQQGQVALVEFFKPLVPVDVLQRLLTGVSGKVEADHAHIAIAASALDACWRGIPFLRPFTDLIVIR
jgi:hypothetical protein